MKYKLFGKSGLRVSEIALGTMTFGSQFGWGNNKRACRRVFDKFSDAGGNFIDTANYYTRGTSETMLGEFIAKERSRFVLATKYTLSMNPKDPNASGNGRKNMVQAVEESLKRLKTDYIDLYWMHAWDGITPIEEVMRTADDLVRAGKILHFGFSDTPAWVVSRANAIAEQRGWTPAIGLQILYNLARRDVEQEYVPMAKELGLAITAWSPLEMGVLTGKYLKGAKQKWGSKRRFDINEEWGKEYLTEKSLKIAQVIVDISKEIKRPAVQIALNWLRQRGSIPIVGAKTSKQLEENLGCVSWELDQKLMKRLDNASQPNIGFPQAFLKRDGIQEIIFGNHKIS